MSEKLKTGNTMNEPAHNGQSGVGALLKASRLRCGADLKDVAQALRIRLPYLEAIEAGRFDDLPGAAYALGFVRSYADYLGLDADEVVRRFRNEAGPGRRSVLRLPTPVSERSIPSGAVMLVGVVIAVLAYGGWYVTSSRDGDLADLVPELPKRLVDLLPSKDRAEAEKSEAAEEPRAATSPEPAEAPSAVLAAKTEPATPVQTPTVPAPTAISEPAAAAAPPAQAPGATAPKAAPAVPATPSRAPAQPVEETPAQAADAPRDEEQATPPPEPAGPGEQAGAADEPEKPVPEAAETPGMPKARSVTAGGGLTPTPAQGQQWEFARAPSPAGSAPAKVEKAGSEVKVEKLAPPAPTVPQPPAPAPVAPEAAAPAEPSRILLTARSDSWIQVREADSDRLVLTRLLRVGDTYRVPNRDGLRLLTGNAGGLVILVDGQEVPSLGPVGAVRRNIALDATRLQAGTAIGE